MSDIDQLDTLFPRVPLFPWCAPTSPPSSRKQVIKRPGRPPIPAVTVAAIEDALRAGRFPSVRAIGRTFRVSPATAHRVAKAFGQRARDDDAAGRDTPDASWWRALRRAALQEDRA